MASRSAPGLGLKAFWGYGEDGWATGMDENLWRLSVLVQPRAKAIVLTADLPGTPTEGDIYIVSDGEYLNNLAIFDDGEWGYVAPFQGMSVFLESAKVLYCYVDGAWIGIGSAAHLKSLYESNDDTNAFTNAFKDKLTNIEPGATGDLTASEVKVLYESNPNTNAFTTAEKTKLAGLESSKFLGVHASLVALQTAFPAPSAGCYAYVDAGVGGEIVAYIWDATDAQYVRQAGASTAETPASIKAKYESNADTNCFTTAHRTKLEGLNANELTIRTYTTDTTLSLANDKGAYVRMASTAANTLTVPPNSAQAFPIGTVIQIQQAGIGQTTIVAGAGVTVNTSETLKLRKKFSSLALTKVATDEWDLIGDVELA